MSRAMNEKELEQLKAHVTQLAKGMKFQAHLGDLTQQLVKMTVEGALGAELNDHLGIFDALQREPPGRK